MRRKTGKPFRSLIKFVLLIQLYCYHNFEVDAVLPRQENLETCDERHHQNNEANIETDENIQRTKRAARLIPAQYLL